MEERLRQNRRRQAFAFVALVVFALGGRSDCLAQATAAAELPANRAATDGVGAHAAAHEGAHATSSGPATALIPDGAYSGDLIFRKGTERVSEVVRGLDGGQFSHVGMLIAAGDLSAELRAVAEQNHHPHLIDNSESDSPSGNQHSPPAPPVEWFVLHATPSEVAGRPDTVVLDPISFFTSPELSELYAVYHVSGVDEGARHAAVDTALARLGQPFSLTKAEGVYCTELIYDAWLSAGLDLDVRFHKLSLLLFPARDFLLPGSLLASPKLKRLGD